MFATSPKSTRSSPIAKTAVFLGKMLAFDSALSTFQNTGVSLARVREDLSLAAPAAALAVSGSGFFNDLRLSRWALTPSSLEDPNALDWAAGPLFLRRL